MPLKVRVLKDLLGSSLKRSACRSRADTQHYTSEMLSLEQTLFYTPAALVVIAIPGPDMLLSLARGLTQGRLAGIANAFGVGVGIMLHTVFAAFGVSALLVASETAFWIMKLVGAAYLVYLGVQQWRSSGELDHVTAPVMNVWHVFYKGVLSNLLNPKVALLYLPLCRNLCAPAAPRTTRVRSDKSLRSALFFLFSPSSSTQSSRSPRAA
jgi:threonine/homoserine/homoserine lactone efflux protein